MRLKKCCILLSACMLVSQLTGCSALEGIQKGYAAAKGGGIDMSSQHIKEASEDEEWYNSEFDDSGEQNVRSDSETRDHDELKSNVLSDYGVTPESTDLSDRLKGFCYAVIDDKAKTEVIKSIIESLNECEVLIGIIDPDTVPGDEKHVFTLGKIYEGVNITSADDGYYMNTFETNDSHIITLDKYYINDTRGYSYSSVTVEAKLAGYDYWYMYPIVNNGECIGMCFSAKELNSEDYQIAMEEIDIYAGYTDNTEPPFDDVSDESFGDMSIYDNGKQSGAHVKKAIEKYVNNDIAIIVHTYAMDIETLFFNYCALLEGSSPSAIPAGGVNKQVYQLSQPAGNISALYTENGIVQYNNESSIINTPGCVAFASNGFVFNSSLLKDSNDNIIGIMFVQETDSSYNPWDYVLKEEPIIDVEQPEEPEYLTYEHFEDKNRNSTFKPVIYLEDKKVGNAGRAFTGEQVKNYISSSDNVVLIQMSDSDEKYMNYGQICKMSTENDIAIGGANKRVYTCNLSNLTEDIDNEKSYLVSLDLDNGGVESFGQIMFAYGAGSGAYVPDEYTYECNILREKDNDNKPVGYLFKLIGRGE